MTLNLRWPTKKHVCQGKMYLSKSKTTSKNKMYAKKKYFIIIFIHLIYHTWHVRFNFPLPNSVTVAIFTVNVSVFLTFTPNISNLFTAIPQHIIISLIHCIRYTAFLTTLHGQLWWDVLPCSYDTHWLNTTFYFLVYELNWTHEVSQFSPQTVLVVLRI